MALPQTRLLFGLLAALVAGVWVLAIQGLAEARAATPAVAPANTARELTVERQGALILDYGVQPTDGVGIVKGETADGKAYFAGLTVADRLPYKPGKIETSEGISRIWVGNQSRDATIELADTKGNTRIRLSVDKNDVPHFEVLDASGKVVRRLLDEPEAPRGR